MKLFYVNLKYVSRANSIKRGYLQFHFGDIRYNIQNGIDISFLSDFTNTDDQWHWIKIHTYRSIENRTVDIGYHKNNINEIPETWTNFRTYSFPFFNSISEIGVAISINSQYGTTSWEFDDLIVSISDIGGATTCFQVTITEKSVFTTTEISIIPIEIANIYLTLLLVNLIHSIRIRSQKREIK